MHYVYWIHDENETDLLTEGYVGISNDPDRRFGEHGDKFGEVKEVLFSFEDRTDAENKEKELRPSWNIGKNIAPGGQAGNRPYGIHTSGWTQPEEANRKRSQSLKGNTNGVYRAEETTVEGITFRSVGEACDYLSETYGYCTATAADRIKNNKPFDKVNRSVGTDNPRARTVIVEGKKFSLKKDAIAYLMETYCFGKNKAIEHIDKGTPIEELLIKRRKKGS